MLADPGDALLYAASARRSMPWSAFRAAVDAAFDTASPGEGGISLLRWEAAMYGDSLGHWDVADKPDNGLHVLVAPPVLARGPGPGGPPPGQCGARSPDTIAEFERARGSLRAVSIRVSGQRRIHDYAPSRIELMSTNDNGLAELAALVGLGYEEEAPAWSIAVECGTVTDYLASLEWQQDDLLDWPRRDFDPHRAACGRPRPTEGTLRLSTYEHPRGWSKLDRLVRAGAVAKVDRSWGRYAVLASECLKVLRYDGRSGTVSVPRAVPLPRLFARALALCSGRAPGHLDGPGRGYRTYSDVPRSVFDTVAAKLGQQ